MPMGGMASGMVMNAPAPVPKGGGRGRGRPAARSAARGRAVASLSRASNAAPSSSMHAVKVSAAPASAPKTAATGNPQRQGQAEPPSAPEQTRTNTRDTGDRSVERTGMEPSSTVVGEVPDLASVPTTLDAQYDALDEDSALRPSIVKPGKVWERRRRAGLLGEEKTVMLKKGELEADRKVAYDLLDALTKSGELEVDHTELHVVVMATHCFDRTLLDTVVQRNVNPIEKVERSELIVASTLHRAPPEALVKPSELKRLRTFSPGLF